MPPAWPRTSLRRIREGAPRPRSPPRNEHGVRAPARKDDIHESNRIAGYPADRFLGWAFGCGGNAVPPGPSGGWATDAACPESGP
ncbi:hypothetical protein DESC_810113 [Desulfosarcina cetonica]|nr:hypothetical protein DESC_810113 [Desulfosarcina cetonica]